MEIPLNPFIPEHIAYVIGYPEGDVRPERDITRAEAATVFFRLLTDAIRAENWTGENPFGDVSPENWYNNAVSVMSKMGIVNGYPEGVFKPDGAITRAELAVIAARFARAMQMRGGSQVEFNDIGGHWAEYDISYAAEIGWVNGYPDGTFEPDANITRAESMTLVNRMLRRIPETLDDILFDEMLKWADNADPNEWYYLAVQEATNSHVPESKAAIYEYWVEMLENRDWAQWEKEQLTFSP